MIRFSVTGLLLLAAVAVPQEQSLPIATWVKNLGDRDSQVRQQALRALMLINPLNTQVLEKYASENRNLKPAQIEGLREAVIFLHIRRQVVSAPAKGGAVLGIGLPASALTDDTGRPIGFSVVNRLNGFIAYAHLEDGDVITGLDAGNKIQEVYTPDQFKLMIRECHAGQMIALSIVRNGKPLTVRFALDATPLLENIENLHEWIQEAELEANLYWEAKFKPLWVRQDI